MLTNALLLFSPSLAYHRCRLRLNGSRQLFRIAHTADESAPFRIAPPPARQLIAFLWAVRADFLPGRIVYRFRWGGSQ